MSTFLGFSVFSSVSVSHPATLQNLVTKDLATEVIQESLLRAKVLGQQEVKKFVQDRLIVAEQCDKPDVSIYEPVHKNNAPTFATLYQVVKHTKDRDQQTVMKADRNVLRRIITSYEAGRSVDLSSGLKHELLPVSVYILGFENCQSFFSYNCPCTYGVPQCTSLTVTTLAKLSKQLRNITYRQLFNKHTILSCLFLKMVVYCNKQLCK